MARVRLDMDDKPRNFVSMTIYKQALQEMEKFYNLHRLSRECMPKILHLRRMLKKFDTSGLVSAGRGGGPKRSFEGEIIEEAYALLKSGSNLSRTRSLVLEKFGKAPSEGYLSKLAKKKGIKCYKVKRQHELTPLEAARRMNFGVQMHERLIENGNLDLKYIIFSDESTVECGEYHHPQNTRVWREKDQRFENVTIDKKHKPKKVHLFACCNHIFGLAGPYFIDRIDVDPEDESEKGKHI